MPSPTFYQLFFICCVIYSVIQLNSANKCGPYEIKVPCIDQCQKCQYKDGKCSQGAVCIPGCNCIPGFLRNSQGNCIPAAFCPATCGPNSKLSNCASRCPPTCSIRNPYCSADCVVGCVCNPGFIKDDVSGICIPESQCPKKNTCGPNSKPSNCASRCPPTCRNRNPICTKDCVVGCVCDPGFIKDDFGNCIPERLCPNNNICGPNSKPSNCASRCPPTCRNRNPICTKDCVVGCVCDRGFIKDDFGNCIPERFCPNNNICGPNSKQSNCASRCPPTCRNRNPICTADCVVGCVCDPGFIKDDFGNCIPEKFCPKPTPIPQLQCPSGEYPVGCIDRCQRCEYRDRPNECFQIQACEKGCNCVPGFLRNRQNQCIPAQFCP